MENYSSKMKQVDGEVYSSAEDSISENINQINAGTTEVISKDILLDDTNSKDPVTIVEKANKDIYKISLFKVFINVIL